MNKGILYTSYVSIIRHGKGKKILITRYKPKWLGRNDYDEWFKDLAPSSNLLDEFKREGIISEEKYIKEYTEQIKEGYVKDPMINKSMKAIMQLLDNGQDVTLYCYEKPNDFCHRHLLSNMFKEIGYEVKELVRY